ncbi:MAG: hypothetical protein FJ137_05550 [Deltaproteobacteria bacterium]|nr:hypothetical protein [Deltaproteobacteria bacterium]
MIGEVVNLAGRLEGATRDHGVSVLVSRAAKDAAEAARDEAGDQTPLPLRPLGATTVKGRERDVEIFAPDPCTSPLALSATGYDNVSDPLLSTLHRG